MLITKYKFQIILFSFYTFQTFQVHPHRIIISHFPCYDSGVVVSHPVTRKAVGNHPDNPVVFVRTFAVADCDLIHFVMVHFVGARLDYFPPLLHGERNHRIADCIFHQAQLRIYLLQ